MAQKRVTFNEHWYRVADLRMRLIPAVRIHKQYFRDKSWHVIQSPVNQEFFRLDDAGYGFVALLNGRRTVADAWHLANERFGDAAPTQGEAIQLIGRLYNANLVQADLPPDAENLFNRFHKRRQREIQNAAMGFLFPRFHVWDPDSFLGLWSRAFGWLFSWKGFVVWAVIMTAGVLSLLDRAEDLVAGSRELLSVSNLPYLYLTFVVAKAVHELAHGFACKCLGQREGESGQVHDMGLMLLILTPAPYVDATSSWAFRSKWRRVVVGGAGVWAELALAAIAAVVWSRTGAGTGVHVVAYNAMFVASVSTVLFNGNPLLRYDAYYILCDIMEMPNLAMRSKDYVHYLVKRYAWGVSGASHSAHGLWERIFFLLYWFASTVYRVFLLAGILITVADLFFFVGVLMALSSFFVWVVLPVFKLLRYIAVSPELSRRRFRAAASTLVVFLAVATPVLVLPMPDRFRIEGVAEPNVSAGVHAASPGFLREVLPSNVEAQAGETVVAVLENPSLESEWRTLLAREKEILARQRLGEAREPSEAQAMREMLAAVREEMARVEHLRRELRVRPDRDGVWVAPRLANYIGAYVEHGQRLGELIDPGSIHIRSFPGQDSGISLVNEALPEIELRVKGRPDLHTVGRIREILPAASKELPTPALGFPAGGETPVDTEDPQGATPAEHVFEIKVDIEGGDDWRLMPGQVVVIRFSTADKPLFDQGVRLLRQLLQRRFHV